MYKYGFGVFCVFFLLNVATAYEVQGGTLTFARQQTDNLTVTFNLEVTFTRSAGMSSYILGDTFQLNGNPQTIFEFGDQTATEPTYTVLSVNVPNDYVIGFAQFNHTYFNFSMKSTPFTAKIVLSNRISTINLPAGRLGLQVDLQLLYPKTGSIIMRMPNPVVVLQNTTFSFTLLGVDPDSYAPIFRLATGYEFANDSSAQQPTQFGIDSQTGLITFNTAGLSVGLYSAQVIAQAQIFSPSTLTYSVSPFDFLIKVVAAADVCPSPPSCSGGTPYLCVGENSCTCVSGVSACANNTYPSFSGATPAQGYTYCQQTLTTFTFTVTASDASTLPLNSIAYSALPQGATVSAPSGSNPMSVTFTWVPTVFQVGKYVMCFVAVDSMQLWSQEQCYVMNVGFLPPYQQISSLLPAYGYYTDQTTFDVIGQFGIGNPASCKINGVVTTGTYLNYRRVRCISPSTATGSQASPTSYQVSVSNQCNVYSTTSPFEYYYQPPLALLPDPDSMLEQQIVNFTMLCTDARYTARETCRINGVVYRGTYSNNNAILCITPPTLTVGSISVEISNEGSYYSISKTLLVSGYGSAGSLMIGPHTGGSAVVITGRTPTTTSRCVFDEQSALAQSVVTNGSPTNKNTTCITPAHAAGAVNLFLNDGGPPRNFTFTYYTESSISSLAPTSIPATGNLVITIAGTNFVDTGNIACKLNITVVTATFVSATRILCTAPANVAGTINVYASIQSLFPAPATSATLSFYETIYPTESSTAASTLVTVTGYYPDSSAAFRCRFGTLPQMLPTWMNSSQIVCPTQNVTFGNASAAGTYTVSVSQNGGASYTDVQQTFRFVAPHTVSQVIPTFSLADTAAVITVIGTNFELYDLTCTINGVNVNLTLVNSTMILCDLWAQDPGFVNVTVSKAVVPTSQGFIYIIYGPGTLSPLALPTTGGTVVILNRTVRFSNLNLVSCNMDGTVTAALSVVLTNSTARTYSVSCSIDVHSVGSGTLSLNDGGWANTFSVGFYVEGVEPMEVAAVGGTNVTVLGDSFTDNPQLSCQFNAVVVPGVVLNSSAVICVAPRLFAGNVWVSASNNGVFTSTRKSLMTFYQTITPTEAPSSGHYTITAVGGFLHSSVPFLCRFDGTQVVATWQTTSTVTCLAPAHVAASGLSVLVAMNGTFVAARPSFRYIPVGTFAPAYGPTFGNTNVTIVGRNITHVNGVECEFGSTKVTALVEPDLELDTAYCVSPVAAVGNVTFTIFDQGVAKPYPSVFTYYNMPIVNTPVSLTNSVILEDGSVAFGALSISPGTATAVLVSATCASGRFYLTSQGRPTRRRALAIPGTVTVTQSSDMRSIQLTGPIADVNTAITELQYIADTYFHGTDTITITARDTSQPSFVLASQTVVISVLSVNQPPSFAIQGDVTSYASTVNNVLQWARNISAGPANEQSQTLTFICNVLSGGEMFQVNPSVSAAGVLSFTTTSDALGISTIRVVLMDNGGVANGGNDTAGAQYFRVSILASANGGGASSPVSIPLVLGLALGGLVVLLGFACLMCCCFKKQKHFNPRLLEKMRMMSMTRMKTRINSFKPVSLKTPPNPSMLVEDLDSKESVIELRNAQEKELESFIAAERAKFDSAREERKKIVRKKKPHTQRNKGDAVLGSPDAMAGDDDGMLEMESSPLPRSSPASALPPPPSPASALLTAQKILETASSKRPARSSIVGSLDHRLPQADDFLLPGALRSLASVGGRKLEPTPEDAMLASASPVLPPPPVLEPGRDTSMQFRKEEPPPLPAGPDFKFTRTVSMVRRPSELLPSLASVSSSGTSPRTSIVVACMAPQSQRNSVLLQSKRPSVAP
eukprot:TRINITY_DN2660_c0_g1_i1.p1 TRINITY_DN2660_c0_g1~~TRINITY_DN2660_c0_g1_i1.p1  ORF type:complete len:1836 (+),score=409.72 TRINITY_DN2660_c0_g1_i1:89-5596(+)